MATASTTYPKISRKLWFLVRDRLKKAIPSAITPTFVISISAMAEGSARSNVIGPLRELGPTNRQNSLNDGVMMMITKLCAVKSKKMSIRLTW